MINYKKNFIGLLTLAVIGFGCVKNNPQPTIPEMPTLTGANAGAASSVITVDAGVSLGNVTRFEQSNVHSATAALPGEKTRQWLQGMNHKTIRTWLALRTISNEGQNYKYESSVPVETSLAFYSTCADSLLIALTAYTPTSTLTLPGNGKGALFQAFIKQQIVYYKNKFPKIKYIQAGNEPDFNGETPAAYYETYKDYYKAVNTANAELGLAGNNTIRLSNAAFTSNTNFFTGTMDYANQFLALYAADTDPGKRLDFFSINCYTEQSNPKLFETVKPQITAALNAKGIPPRQVFVTEYGLVGGTFIPAAWTQSQIITAWPAAQLAKAYYLYEGGVERVFNWAIAHGDILHKSEIADLTNAYPNPYGYALMLGKELSDRGIRIKATSTKLTDKGLGINAIASMGNGKGIAVLVWNYNYTNFTPDQEIKVQINNIPKSLFPAKLNATVYMIDSKNNNIYNDPTNAKSLTALSTTAYDYSAGLSVPLKLEGNSVALIVLNP
jgi:hypothetical protein